LGNWEENIGEDGWSRAVGFVIWENTAWLMVVIEGMVFSGFIRGIKAITLATF